MQNIVCLLDADQNGKRTGIKRVSQSVVVSGVVLTIYHNQHWSFVSF